MCSDFDRLSTISGWVPACYPPPWHANTHTHTHTQLPATEDQAKSTQAQWGNTSLICLPHIPIQLSVHWVNIHWGWAQTDSKAQWLTAYWTCMMTFTDGERACHNWNKTLCYAKWAMMFWLIYFVILVLQIQ